MEAKDGGTNLQYGSVYQGFRGTAAFAGHRDAIDQGFTAGMGIDQQANTILPGKIQMFRTDAGTGNNQVTGTHSSQDTFPRDRKPGVYIQVPAA